NLLPKVRKLPPAATPELEPPRLTPWLENGRIEISSDRGEAHLLEGRLLRAEGVAWAAGGGLALGFHVDPSAAAWRRVSFQARTPSFLGEEQVVSLALNGHTLGFFRPSAEPAAVEFELPFGSLKGDNVLRFQAAA